MGKHHVFIESTNNVRIVGILSTPSKRGKYPAVLFLHGFMSSKESKKTHAIIEHLKEDMVCLAIDFRGHRESTGKIQEITLTGCLDDAKVAINFLCEQPEVDHTKLGVYGSSLGGATALHLAAENPNIKALVLLAAVGDFKDLHTGEFSDENIAKWQTDGYTMFDNAETKAKVKVDYTFVADTRAYDGFESAKQIKAKTLILHGDRDDVVPLEHGKKLNEAIPDSTFQIVEGEGHIFGNDKDVVTNMLKDIADFFRGAFP